MAQSQKRAPRRCIRVHCMLKNCPACNNGATDTKNISAIHLTAFGVPEANVRSAAKVSFSWDAPLLHRAACPISFWLTKMAKIADFFRRCFTKN